MPVSLEFLRGVMGALCIMFAHFFGRASVRRARGVRKSRIVSWGLRTAITGAAVAVRHRLDLVDGIVFALAAALFALGAWDEYRPKHEEDLSKEIVPKD